MREAIDDEVFGTLRIHGRQTIWKEMDPASLYLTTGGYGRRLHADERRRPTRCSTRARSPGAARIQRMNETSRDSRLAEEKKSAAPSNFWLEMRAIR